MVFKMVASHYNIQTLIAVQDLECKIRLKHLNPFQDIAKKNSFQNGNWLL